MLYSEALEIIRAHSSLRILPSETVPLVLAFGRVLSGDVVSNENIPPAANSAMDGYAVRTADTSGASKSGPALLRLIGESSAGTLFGGEVKSGEAVRIMTGGLLPAGADSVIQIEATTESDGIVSVQRPTRAGEAVRPAGEDIRSGELVLKSGRRLTAADIGVLASLGITNVPVRVPPKVGILCTGNEIVEAHRTPGLGEIRNSSAPALYALCTEAGAEPIELGIARDNPDELRESLEQGLQYDIFLTTGGVSAGRYDLVPELLKQLGVEVHFHKVEIKPGRPVLFGTLEQDGHVTLVFGLPGNPVSTLVTFRLFVREAIAALTGETRAPLTLTATLITPIKKPDHKKHFVRGIVVNGSDGELVVRTAGSQSSGALSTVSRANCLILLAEDSSGVVAGERVAVELL